MISISTITWQPQSDPTTPLASAKLDFTQDQSWQFQLPAMYLQRSITPNGVTVDNSANTGLITVTSGPLATSVPPFTRANIDLPKGSNTVTFQGSNNTDTVPLEFYLVPPAPGATGQNQFAVNKAVAAAIASATLGTMQPIINGSGDIWPEGTNIAQGAGTTYGPEGWCMSAAAAAATMQQQGGIIASRFSSQFGRNNGSASVQELIFGTSLESSDSFQFLGNPISLGFDVQFGANFSGANLTAQIISGTGIDQNGVTGFTGNLVLAQQAVVVGASATRVTFTSAGAVPANVTQIGVLFRYTPTGVGGAADFIRVARVQLDSGSPQSYRPVPLEMERARCERFFELFNSDQQLGYIFGGALGQGATEIDLALRFKKKRAVPAIQFNNNPGGFNGTAGGVGSVATAALAATRISTDDARIPLINAGGPFGVGAFWVISNVAGAGGGQIKVNARL